MHESYEQPKEGKESDTSAIRYKSVLGTYTYEHMCTQTHTRTHIHTCNLRRLYVQWQALQQVIESKEIMMVVMLNSTWDKPLTAEYSASHLEDATSPVGALSGSAM